MAILIIFVLLLPLGLTLAYRLSASVSARKRALAAVEPLRSLRADLTMQYDGVKDSVTQAATRLGQDVRSERLRAISVDAIKHQASGLRLQALKDAGLNTVLDLQGWSAQRLSELRGVGPKSAGTIAAVAHTLAHSSNALPVRCPSPPFAGVTERNLMCAIYVDLSLEARHSADRNEFTSVLDRAEARIAKITAGTAFSRWLMGLFGSEQATEARQDAAALVRDLQDDPHTVALQRSLGESLADLRALRLREIPQEKLMAAYEEDAPLYEWMMAKAMGTSESADRPIARQRHEPATVTTHVSSLTSEPTTDVAINDSASTSRRRMDSQTIDQAGKALASESELSEAVHVEFGRLVPGPPPLPQSSPASHRAEPPSYARTAAEAIQQLDRVRAARKAGRALEGTAALVPSAPMEELVIFKIGQPADTGDVKIPVPANPIPASKKKLRWVLPGETVVIQGMVISGSYFFCGSPKRNSEPFVLDPSLPVARERQEAGEESASSHRYGSFTPHMRLRYLEWLAAGTRDRDVPSGFGKLYFQGLERRLLQHLRRPGALSDEESDPLLREVQRIEGLFRLTPNSVSYQSNALLQLFAARAFIGAPMPALPALGGRRDELPFELRLGLGCFMKEDRPIPAEWALCWAHAEPTIYLRTAPLRCPTEFEAAFRHLYAEKYGSGLVLKSNKTMLSTEYQPMWSGGDDSKIQLTFTDVPDVKALTAPQSALGLLVSEATEMIDSYSRALGPNVAGVGSLESLLRLPSVIWSSEALAKLQQLHSTFVEPMLPTTCQTIFTAFGATGDIGSTRVMDFARYLQKIGVGFEPDVLAGARKPKPTDCVVLFPLPEAAEEAASGSVKAATLAVTLAAILAIADGHASEKEAAAVDELIRQWAGLRPNSRARLRAVYRLTLQHPPALPSLKGRLEALTLDDRKQVTFALTMIATSDGVVSPEEVKLLEWVYRTLALEEQTLYSTLHSGSESGRSYISEGHSSATDHPSEQLLDSSRLSRLRQQSSEVSQLLAGVFAEEDDTVTSISTSQSATVHAATQRPVSDSGLLVFPDLTATDQQFVTLLMSKATWSREELLRSAAAMQIMLDGTLERINDAAFDRLGEFLVEGDDPIYVQQTLLEAAE